VIATLERLLAGDHLDAADAEELFGVLAEPSTAPALAAGLLVALRAKGETSEEIRGLARAMRSRALPCDLGPRDGLVDIVGTGGDGTSSLNLSTGAALLAAAAGARVVKHGGGAVSGRSGSADVLCALGVTLPRSDEEARALLEATGFTFLHAPRFHVALRGLGPVRRALGTRTVLNVLGPLCNPAAPPFGVIGAFSLDTARIMAEALAGLAIERAFVVHGAMGWDEPTPIGAFHLFDVSPHHVTASFRDPLDAGLPRCCPDELRGDVASLNARALIAVFDGEHSAHRDALVLGAALALEVSGRCRSMDEGVVAAAAALDDGRAAGLLAVVAAFPARASGELHA
jgi:anthranilate phosphoribosyltransferase